MKRQKMATQQTNEVQNSQRSKFAKYKKQSFKDKSQGSFHADNKAGGKKKRRDKRDKKRDTKTEKLSTESPYMSKNEKKKLRIIHEETEESKMTPSTIKNEASKREQYFDDKNIYVEDFDETALQKIKDRKMHPPKKHKFNKYDHSSKSNSVTFEKPEEMEERMDKKLSFRVESDTIPIPEPVRKKSNTSKKSKSKEKRQQDNRCEFIPLRDSQVTEYYFFAPAQRSCNRDDFEVAEERKEELDFEQPRMRKKGLSYGSKAFGDPLEDSFTCMKKKSKTGVSAPTKTLKFDTEESEIIFERKSEDVRSSLDDDEDSIIAREFIDPNMNTLFVPNVEGEATRKRVKSFKKRNEEQPKKLQRSNIDPYLEDSDEDNSSNDINQFIGKTQSAKVNKESIDELLDSSEQFSNPARQYNPILEAEEDKETSPDYRIKITRAQKEKEYDKLLDYALQVKPTLKSPRPKAFQPFAWEEGSIHRDNYSDEGMPDSFVDPLEDYEPNYKKGGGKFQKEAKSKAHMPKKHSKTGKKAELYKHKNKRHYDPSQRKRAAQEEQQHHHHKHHKNE